MTRRSSARTDAMKEATAGAEGSRQIPMVAIVGRPNVGKSTLFNRLIGERRAIVYDQPGVTRDRISGRLDLGSRTVDLVDTGGLVPHDDPIGLNQQVHLAIEEADVLILVVDGRAGPVPADHEVVEVLWKTGRPVVLAVNKGDTTAAKAGFDEFFTFGFEQQVLVSAEHGGGMPDLLDAVRAELPEAPADAGSLDGDRIAIVGRPNVGKSSLINQLSRSERALVSPIAGTTRDPIDTQIELDGKKMWLVDTAGIRRRSQVSEPSEELAVMMARRQIEQADLALLLIDASAGVTTGDLSIAGAIWEAGKAAVVLFNKWDLLAEKDEEHRDALELGWERLCELLRDPPRVNISALTGRRLDKVLAPVPDALARWRQDVPTSELNRVLERAVQRHQAPAHKGRAWKLLYATQVASGPPTFMLFANRTIKRQDPYRRFLENQLRDAFDLGGIPLRLVIRERSRSRSGSKGRPDRPPGAAID